MSEIGFGLILISMNYLIYKITNKLNNKIYVGKHKTNLIMDGYFGSGLLLKRAMEKHGSDQFTREILFECKTEEEMNQKEAEIVDEEFISRPDTYNIRLGGRGGFDYINKHKLQNNDETRSMREEQAVEMRKKFSHMINTDSDFRESWKEKMRNGIRLHQAVFGNNTFGGKTHTDETKKKMSLAKRGMYNGKKNPAFGKHWITNGLVSKLVSKNLPLEHGWKKGRV